MVTVFGARSRAAANGSATAPGFVVGGVVMALSLGGVASPSLAAETTPTVPQTIQRREISRPNQGTGRVATHGVSQSSPSKPLEGLAQSPSHCSGELTDVVDELIRALPNYANRIIQRQRVGQRDQNGIWRSQPSRTYVIVAGQPDIEPLASSTGNAPLYQIFFTTLERQYLQTAPALAEPQSVQQFHQLVLAQVKPPEEWRVIRLRSQIAPYPANHQLLSPPRNADNGAIAEAIRLWLRDCAAGSARRG